MIKQMMTPYDNGDAKETLDNLADLDGGADPARPSKDEAEAAVDTLLRWIGEDPPRGASRHPGTGRACLA